MQRDLWIDQIGQNRDFRVREWVSGEARTLETLASYEQAEAYIAELHEADARRRAKAEKATAAEPARAE